MRHLERLLRDGSDTSQVGLVALIFKDRFFAQFDAIFLLELFNNCFQELKLVHLFLDFSLNFKLNSLLNPSQVHAVSGNLAEKLPRSDSSELKSFHIKLAAELNTLSFIVFLLVVLDPGLPGAEKHALAAPDVNPPDHKLFVSFSLGPVSYIIYIPFIRSFKLSFSCLCRSSFLRLVQCFLLVSVLRPAKSVNVK